MTAMIKNQSPDHCHHREISSVSDNFPLKALTFLLSGFHAFALPFPPPESLGFSYARHNIEKKLVCDEFDDRLDILQPRLVSVIGPTTDNFIQELFAQRELDAAKGFNPEMQFIHEHYLGYWLYLLFMNASRSARTRSQTHRNSITFWEQPTPVSQRRTWISKTSGTAIPESGSCSARKSLTAAFREQEVLEDSDGLVSIAGGNFTTCRSMAEEVIDLVFCRLGRRHPGQIESCRALTERSSPQLIPAYSTMNSISIC